MRYLFGFMCVLALGLMACSETAGTGGSGGTAGMGGDGGTGGNGGSGGSGGETGDQFPAIDTLELTLNRVYDNGDQRGDEKYTFEVADLTVTHRWVRSNDPPDLLPPATRDAMDALVAVVQSTSYRTPTVVQCAKLSRLEPRQPTTRRDISAERRSPAQGRLGSCRIQKGPETIRDLGAGVPNHSELELRCGVPHGLGGAAEAGGVTPRPVLSAS
jgi:hypothetical protein